MPVIAVVNTKGGVGKTTLTAALAVEAARECDRVAMVDLDPQKSLIQWWTRRGETPNPTIFEGASSAADAVEALSLNGWDWVFIDSPPAFIDLIKETVAAADFVIIPVVPSAFDLVSTQDAVILTREAGTPFMACINNATQHEKNLKATATEVLKSAGVLVARTDVANSVAHKQSATLGKTAAELANGKKAGSEIAELWAEVKAAATKAAKKRGKAGTND